MLADIDEALQSGVEPATEQHLLAYSAPDPAPRADRGFEELLARLTELTEKLPDRHMLVASSCWLDAHTDLFGGHPEKAADTVFEVAQEMETLGYLYAAWACRAAIWARDAERLRRMTAAA